MSLQGFLINITICTVASGLALARSQTRKDSFYLKEKSQYYNQVLVQELSRTANLTDQRVISLLKQSEGNLDQLGQKKVYLDNSLSILEDANLGDRNLTRIGDDYPLINLKSSSDGNSKSNSKSNSKITSNNPKLVQLIAGEKQLTPSQSDKKSSLQKMKIPKNQSENPLMLNESKSTGKSDKNEQTNGELEKKTSQNSGEILVSEPSQMKNHLYEISKITAWNDRMPTIGKKKSIGHVIWETASKPRFNFKIIKAELVRKDKRIELSLPARQSINDFFKRSDGGEVSHFQTSEAISTADILKIKIETENKSVDLEFSLGDIQETF